MNARAGAHDTAVQLIEFDAGLAPVKSRPAFQRAEGLDCEITDVKI